MSLHWYACISANTYHFETHYILLEMDWWALSNTSLIVRIHLAIHEILANKDFIATDGLISQSFVVTLVPPTYVQIALIWGFLVQLGLGKLVYWLWRYKLNEVCNIFHPYNIFTIYFFSNSLLLKFHSFAISNFSWLLTFAFNLLPNSVITSLIFSKFFFFSHVSYFTINLFYYIKYFTIPIIFLLFNFFDFPLLDSFYLY